MRKKLISFALSLMVLVFALSLAMPSTIKCGMVGEVEALANNQSANEAMSENITETMVIWVPMLVMFMVIGVGLGYLGITQYRK